jgi:hypothetical protein
MDGWIVVLQNIVGTGGRTVYNWDSKCFPSRELAIEHGFTLDRSDDFNVARIENGKVVQFFWMDEELTPWPFEDVNNQLGLE